NDDDAEACADHSVSPCLRGEHRCRRSRSMSHGHAKKMPPAVDGGPSWDELKPALDPIVARYPVRAGAMMPVLWAVQKARGWLSPRSVKEVAAYLEVPQAHVEGVISFYTMFKGHPVGRNVVMVCKTLSCRLRGAQEVID